MTVGMRIRARRKELGLSAEYLAEHLGVSPATIYRYEKGEIEKMPIDILKPLAALLETTPAYLMGWEDLFDVLDRMKSPNSSVKTEEKPPADPLDEQFVSLFNSLGDREKALALAMLEALVKNKENG